MSRRLLNRSSRPAEDGPALPALPAYEPLSCALSESAKRALDELSNSRGTASYEAQLKDSVRHLGHSVGDLNERLRLRKERLHDLQRRRWEKGTEKNQEEERLEAHVPGFEREVEQLTCESERALRQVIDRRAELEDEASVLGDLFYSAVTRIPAPTKRKRRVANVLDDDDDDDDDDEEDEDEDEDKEGKDKEKENENDDQALEDSNFSGLLSTFRARRAEKKSQYTSMSPHERYALHNDYAGFKKLWHDAAVGEDGPPLPDASRWFLSNGEPNMSTSTQGRRKHTSRRDNVDNDDGEEEAEEGDRGEEEEEEEEEDDDDIAIARENRSLKCPLTLLPMAEPYANRKCPHIFEKSAILDYLGTRDEHQCPQTGCSQTFSRAQFKHDFFHDEAMLRRIQRTKQAEEAHSDMDMDMDIDDDDNNNNNTEDDISVVLGPERSVRRGRVKVERVTASPSGGTFASGVLRAKMEKALEES